MVWALSSKIMLEDLKFENEVNWYLLVTILILAGANQIEMVRRNGISDVRFVHVLNSVQFEVQSLQKVFSENDRNV